jgi:rhodanese-related sulfurtransferase
LAIDLACKDLSCDMEHLPEFIQHHPYYVALIVAAAVAVLVYELRHRAQHSGAIGAQDAIRLMNQGAAVLDVRPAAAFAAGHISGARSLPPEELDKAGTLLKRYKDRPVIVYCERGVSAAATVRNLGTLGFSRVFNLRGGLSSWRAENLPVVTD